MKDCITTEVNNSTIKVQNERYKKYCVEHGIDMMTYAKKNQHSDESAMYNNEINPNLEKLIKRQTPEIKYNLFMSLYGKGHLFGDNHDLLKLINEINLKESENPQQIKGNDMLKILFDYFI